MKHIDVITKCEECGYQFIKRISYEIINTDVKREYP